MTKIEKYFVIVCEEDYPIEVWDWDNLTNAERVQCVDDARNPDVDFIYNQEWIIQDGDSSLYESLNELVGRSCKIMSKVLIHKEADPVIVTGLVSKVLDAVDDFNADLEQKSKDAFDLLEKARTDDKAEGCDRWEKDSQYMQRIAEGEAEDQAYYSRIMSGVENCFDCLWHGGKGDGCVNPNLKNEATLYIRLQRESLQESEALGGA